MPPGIMKTSYYLIAAVGLTAVVAYARYGRQESCPVPSQPVPRETAQAQPGTLPPLPIIPKVTLPDITLPPVPDVTSPPEGELRIPSATPTIPQAPTVDSTETLPLPLSQLPTVPTATPVVPSSSIVPAIPEVPTVAEAEPPLTFPPVLPPIPQVVIPETPVIPQPPAPTDPPAILNQNPTIPVAPSPPVPVTTAIPQSSSETLNQVPPVSFPRSGRFVVLRGNDVEDANPAHKLLVELMRCKLIEIEGIVPAGKDGKDNVIVRQGAMVRSLAKTSVLFVGETRDEVYRYMRGRVSSTDPSARLVVARWCMLNGLREQALAEAKEIVQLQPESESKAAKAALDLVRSLEESLKQFPPDGSVAAAKPQAGKLVTVADTDMEITPEGATSFATRVQPILANVCIDCHSRTDHPGRFKLTRVTEFEPGPQATQDNLRATIGQLLKSDPVNSPLLVKAITVHGGLKQPPFVSRQTLGFRILENWVLMSIGSYSSSTGATSPSAPPMAQPAQPAQPAVVSTPASPPASKTPGLPTVPAVLNPGLPPVEVSPALPSTNPTPPSVPSSPTAPTVPAVPPVVTVPPVLPTPPVMPPAIPSLPPIIPQADTAPKTTPPPIVPIPPAVSIPPLPGSVQPATAPAGGSQFGSDNSTKPIQPASSTSRDEFDPSSFNQGVPNAGRAGGK
jgi:hypothetical protein